MSSSFVTSFLQLIVIVTLFGFNRNIFYHPIAFILSVVA